MDAPVTVESCSGCKNGRARAAIADIRRQESGDHAFARPARGNVDIGAFNRNSMTKVAMAATRGGSLHDADGREARGERRVLRLVGDVSQQAGKWIDGETRDAVVELKCP
jgi:hypothetical protein